MKNHAFLIIAHKQPKLLARIVNILSAPNHYFFINVDAKTKNYEDFVNHIGKDNDHVFFLKDRVSVFHCGFTTTYCEIALLKYAKNSNISLDYYHLISGQDYPLRSNEQFDAFFENTDDSFMCYNSDEDAEYWKPIYEQHTIPYYDKGGNNMWDKIIIKFGCSKIGRKYFRRKPIESICGGWQWFTWNAKVVDFVLDYLNKNPKFLRRFKYTVSADEKIFLTLLNHHTDELKIHRHFPLRYVSWEPYRPIKTKYRPYDLVKEDYERVVNSAAFFCRKIDEKASAELLDMIDAQRGQKYDISEHNYFL